MPLLIEKWVSDILSLPIEETNSNKNAITIIVIVIVTAISNYCYYLQVKNNGILLSNYTLRLIKA